MLTDADLAAVRLRILHNFQSRLHCYPLVQFRQPDHADWPFEHDHSWTIAINVFGAAPRRCWSRPSNEFNNPLFHAVFLLGEEHYRQFRVYPN